MLITPTWFNTIHIIMSILLTISTTMMLMVPGMMPRIETLDIIWPFNWQMSESWKNTFAASFCGCFCVAMCVQPYMSSKNDKLCFVWFWFDMTFVFENLKIYITFWLLIYWNLNRYTSFSIIRYFLANPGSIDGEKQNKNCPQWALNPQPPDHHSNALLTVLGRCLLSRRFLKRALFHAPLHMLDFDYF